MGQGIVCRNQPHTSQVHISAHEVHVCCRSVGTAGSCCSGIQITSKHSSRDIPSRVGGSPRGHGGQGESLAGSAAPCHPSHLPAQLSSTEAPSECRETAQRWFRTHHPATSQLPVLVLLVGVIHLPVHAQLSAAKLRAGLSLRASRAARVTSQPPLSRQKGEGGSGRRSQRAPRSGSVSKGTCRFSALAKLPRPSSYERPSACKRAGPWEHARK